MWRRVMTSKFTGVSKEPSCLHFLSTKTIYASILSTEAADWSDTYSNGFILRLRNDTSSALV